MAFRYRKSMSGESVIPVKDFTLDTTYATTAAKGDVVRLNGSGNVVLAATGDTNVLGVLEGFNFEGITATKPVTAKVRISSDAVYEADKVGAGAITVGTAYGIDGSSNLDTADTTTLIAKIVEVVNGKPYVVITSRQIV
jgi:hypothetical protein